MSDIQHFETTPTLSDVTVYGNTVYLAGQVPDDDSLDITGQTKQVLANIDKMLALAGTDKSRMLSVQVFIKDLSDFEAFNAVWAEWVADITPPSRATIEANLVNPNWLIEIMVVAAKP
ncbi:MAG: RidA family protein [Moraxella sp.]|nr:RidA family protein [Moraxella sp.]